MPNVKAKSKSKSKPRAVVSNHDEFRYLVQGALLALGTYSTDDGHTWVAQADFGAVLIQILGSEVDGYKLMGVALERFDDCAFEAEEYRPDYQFGTDVAAQAAVEFIRKQIYR